MPADPMSQIEADERAARKQVQPEPMTPERQSILDSLPMVPAPARLLLPKDPDNAR